MQSERATNALANRNQSAAEHQECCFWVTLPDAGRKAHASLTGEEAGVEMKRPGLVSLVCFPFYLFSPLQLRQMPGLGEKKKRKEKEPNKANGDQPLLRARKRIQPGKPMIAALRIPR
jgi:hypothetical protein